MKNVYIGCDCGCRCTYAQDPVSGREVGVSFGHGLGVTTLAYSTGHDDELWVIDVKDVAKDKEFTSLAKEVDEAFDSQRRDIVETFYERVRLLVSSRMKTMMKEEEKKSGILSSIKQLFN
jgi:hypothetical protein